MFKKPEVKHGKFSEMHRETHITNNVNDIYSVYFVYGIHQSQYHIHSLYLCRKETEHVFSQQGALTRCCVVHS